MRIRADGFSASTTRAWNRPCSPKPRMATCDHPSGAKARMHTPLAAAVRAAVISAASMIASGNPVSGSFRSSRPEMYGSPRVGLSG